MGATEGPWILQPGENHGALFIVGNDERCVHLVYIVTRAKAELIVRAVEAHNALLAACKAALASATPHPKEHPAMTMAWQQLKAAIALAEVKP